MVHYVSLLSTLLLLFVFVFVFVFLFNFFFMNFIRKYHQIFDYIR